MWVVRDGNISQLLQLLVFLPCLSQHRQVRIGVFPERKEILISLACSCGVARDCLGTAETEIASKFVEAARPYQNNPVAIHLRAMNMLYEGLKEKGAMMIIPSSAVESMGMGGLMGAAALAQQRLTTSGDAK